VRLDRAFHACFRRIRAGATDPGYPRLRGQGRDESLPFPQVPVGGTLDTLARRVRLSSIGPVKILWRRPLQGTPQTATLRRRSTGKWSVTCSWEGGEPAPWPNTGQPVGMAVGLKSFATRSPGPAIANPRCSPHDEPALVTAHRRLRQDEKGPPERAQRRPVAPCGGSRRRAEHVAAR
jgi:putative transposase